MLDEYERGSAVVHVRCDRLAAALIAMGIPLRDDPGYIKVETKAGEIIDIYNFHLSSACGRYLTGELVKLYHEGDRFIQREEEKERENPDYLIHPWARLLAMLKHYDALQEVREASRPLVGFAYMGGDGRPKVKYFIKGTAKHRKAIELGLKQQ